LGLGHQADRGSASGLWFVAFDANVLFVFESYGEVKGSLHPDPSIGRAAEGLRKPDCHLGRDAGFFVDQVVERLPSYTENSGGFGYAEPEGLKAVMPNDSARMDRVRHGHGVLLLSVVIDPFDPDSVAAAISRVQGLKDRYESNLFLLGSG